MSNRIDSLFLEVSGGGRQDRTYTAERIATVLDGAGGGGTARTAQVATYSTQSPTPTVYYTALYVTGLVLSARSTSGVTFANGLYQKTQDTTSLTDFIAVWDEGNPDFYVSEWIVVDS